MPSSTTVRTRSNAAAVTPYPSPLDHLTDVRELVRLRAQVSLHASAANTQLRHYNRGPDPEVAQAKLPQLRKSFRDHQSLMVRRERATAKTGIPLPIDTLAERLELSPLDRTVMLLASLTALDLSIEDDFHTICDSTGSTLTVMAVLNFLGLPLTEQLSARARFRADAPLRARDLITLGLGRRASAPEDLLRADISLTPQSLALILGDDQLSDELVEFSSIEDPLSSFERVVLPSDDIARILAIVDSHDHWKEARASWGLDRTITYGRGSFLLFSGPPGTGKTLTAHAVAHRLGKRVLSVDIPTLMEHVDNMRLLPGLFREARLRGAVLFFDECETFFESRRRGNQLMSILLTELERFDGFAVMATNLPENLDEALFRRLIAHVRFEAPDAHDRQSIWRHHLPEEAPLSDDVNVESLGRRYRLTGGQIKNATLNAFARAFTIHGIAGPITMSDLEQAARDQLRPISNKDDRVTAEWSEVRLDSVHFPDHLHKELRMFLGMAGEQRLIREEWGVAKGETPAQVILLHGLPGTGKTFCARALAGELGRPLLRVAVGGLRSKYVGESEQTLTRLFRHAAKEGAVLLLDEVDALVTTRGDHRAAHHDDVLTSTLLTLLDTHDGVVVMTTNRPSALDPALSRRIIWHLSVPLPDAFARLQIWRAMLPDTAPLHPGLNLEHVARRHALSGGDIRTIAIRAAASAATTGALITAQLLHELASVMVASDTSGRHVAFEPASS